MRHKITMTAMVPDGRGFTVPAVCVFEADFEWSAMDMNEKPLANESPALVVELSITDDADATEMRQITASPKGHVPDYKAWARRKPAA